MARLDVSRPRLMGILNLTPDSFSDGGAFSGIDAALARVDEMLEQGADMIDVGGESTRPQSQRVPAAEQIRRICEPIAAITQRHPDLLVSADTTLAAVAAAAFDAGAGMLNDISALRDDPAMIGWLVKNEAPVCLMHMQGAPQTMQDAPRYEDVVAEVCAFLTERAQFAEQSGVAKERILIDPGIGFGKTTEHNLTLIAALDKIAALGWPVLLGASRKRFMGHFCKADTPVRRVPASCATTVLGALAGVSVFRAHDVWQHRQVLDLLARAFPEADGPKR